MSGPAIATLQRPTVVRVGYSLPWVSVASGLLAMVFFVGASALAFARHEAFATGRHDLEIYTQVAWNLANGAPFASTLLRTNSLHLAEHLALVLLPLAPLYGLLPSPRLLLVLQQLSLTLVALTVGYWARARLGPVPGLAVLACYLATPVLAGIALDDFHAVVPTAALIAASLVLALAGFYRSASLLVLLAGVMEEEAALAVAGVGLVILLHRKSRLGLGLIGVGGTLLATAAVVIMPAFHHPGSLPTTTPSRSAGHFSQLARQPELLVERLQGSRGRDALVAMMLPTGGLALLSPQILVAGAPTFAALLGQDRDDTLTRHWAAPLVPVVWLATISTLAMLGGQRGGGRGPAGSAPMDRSAPRTLQVLGLALLAMGTVGGYLLASPLPGGAAFDPEQLRRDPSKQALARAASLVLRDAPAAVSANVAAHMANRRDLFIYPVDDQYASALGYEDRKVDAFVLDLTDPATQRVSPLSKVSPLTADPPYIVQSTAHKTLVLTRSAAQPSHPMAVRFRRSLMFQGYDLARSADQVRLTLHWESYFIFSADFRRVVELVDASGQVIGQDSELELTRTLSTQKWKAGQQVRDEVEFALPRPVVEPLRARIHWENRDRKSALTLEDGSESLEIPIE